MENSKTFILKKLTAFAMTLLMIFSAVFTPALATEGEEIQEAEYIASVGETLYESLQEAVNEAENGATVILTADAEGDGVIVPGGKEIIFDFGGFTYTVSGKLVGSAGTETLGMQLLRDAEVTLKNGTLRAGEKVKLLVQNYSDLTVDDFKIEGEGALYALSNNCGDILVTGESNISCDNTAFDLWYNLQGNYPEGVSVTFDENFTGTVDGMIEYGADVAADGWFEKTALTVKNGTFDGAFLKSSDFDLAQANIVLYGGAFIDPRAEMFCAEDYKVIEDGERFRVVPNNYIVSDAKGNKYESLQEAVEAAESEAVLTLLADASGDGVVVPEGKEIIFDFGGFTYTVDGKLVGSAGTETQAMQLLKGARVTLKNGALKAGKDVKFLVQNYSDLTVENMLLDVTGVDYQYAYALSNNCGNVTVRGKTDISSDYVAFDLWYNLIGAYSEGVNVTFDETFTGTVKGDIEYGAYAVAEGWTEKTALVIKGGTFLGEIRSSSDFEDKANITAYAGTFSDADVAEYCAEDYKVIEDGENYKVIPKEYIVSSADGKKYESIQEAVDSTEGEATLTFLCDAEGDGIFVAKNKEITLDFGGFTYTVNGELVGSEGSETQGMHLGRGAVVTLKNGTFKADRDMKILVQNYCDLTLENVTLDAEKAEGAYALSNNFGKVTVKGESNILSKNVAFDLYYNMMGAYSEGISVTFDEDFTGTVSGDIEYGAEVLTENWTEKTALVIRGGTFLGEFINLNENELYAGDMNITLYGGSFLKPVFEDWCAEGSEPAVFDDGTYGPCFHEFTEKIEDRDHFRAEPDCEKGNVYYYDCSKCVKMGAETFDDGAKLGHSFSSYIPNNDGSCIKDPTATAVCDREGCNGTDTVIFEGTAKHGWGEWTTVKAASCTVNGAEERYCDLCGAREERAVSAKHTYSKDFITDTEAVCGKAGSKSRHCIYCDAKTDVTSIPAKTHINKETVTPATDKGPGYIKTTCTLCGNTSSKKIYRIQTFKLSKTSYTYTGKAFKPSVTVKDYKGKMLVNGKDYTVKYSKNKAIGKGKVIITFKGNYTGTKTLEFSINPAKVGSLKLTAKNDAMGLSWKTVKGADGYQISYSTSKKFTKKTTKTTYIKKQKTKKTTLKKLKNATKYYVRIRAYKKVSGKNVYGAYSSVKNVKVK